MKTIIYAGLGLFSIASLYGIKDYYHTKNNGRLSKLYAPETTMVKSLEENKFGIKNMPKNDSTFREIKLSDFSRGRIVPTKFIKKSKSHKRKH